MNHRVPFPVLIAALAALVLISCGDPTIQLGRELSGQLTTSDNYWQEHDPYTGEVIGAGYSDDFQVDVVEGQAYTVTFGTSNGYGNFEDQEGGRFYWSDGSAASCIVLVPDNPQTVTWIPAMTGMNGVDVCASTDNVPLDYTVLIVAP